jgi:hypothetical protein
MKHRFLIHLLSHTILVVDITEIDLPSEIYPPDGQRKMVPTLRFQSWKDAEQYFVRLGSDIETLKKISTSIRKTSLAVLTIV